MHGGSYAAIANFKCIALGAGIFMTMHVSLKTAMRLFALSEGAFLLHGVVRQKANALKLTCGTLKMTMKTKEFVSTLRVMKSKQLIFENQTGAAIHPGYHLTELKSATFDTVDCGGQTNRWNETIVQLWGPENEDSDEFMSTKKFLHIYDQVSGMIALDPEAEIRFEYSDENFAPSNYHVEKISENGKTVHVTLRLPQMTCKARDRRSEGAACCA